MNNKIVLANEGVFPITKDWEGYALPHLPATGMHMPGTIQGEGLLMGMPSLFIRLASCNLRCIWNLPDGTISKCDTPYASFDVKEVKRMEVDQVVQLVKHNIGAMKHVVITGGEPFLQNEPLALLSKQLKEELKLHITIETNGTLFHEEVAKNIDLFSISPKLKNSTPNEAKLKSLGLNMNGPMKSHGEKRYNLKTLQEFINFSKANKKNLQLKFVVGQEEDEKEIVKYYITPLTNIEPQDIMLMPLGANREELKKTTPMVLEMAIRNGWRYTSRIHIDLFGAKPGV
ncbi:MAG TPA: 7-carboxy-7-deazaguanine synthase QueE [Marinilabiliaceae bacterium]|nr:7-carboxy-7-deazaguanine synthase QueE [Marinilabiliaceae bacterium]